jgi:hypothetical protein
MYVDNQSTVFFKKWRSECCCGQFWEQCNRLVTNVRKHIFVWSKCLQKCLAQCTKRTFLFINCLNCSISANKHWALAKCQHIAYSKVLRNSTWFRDFIILSCVNWLRPENGSFKLRWEWYPRYLIFPESCWLGLLRTTVTEVSCCLSFQKDLWFIFPFIFNIFLTASLP